MDMSTSISRSPRAAFRRLAEGQGGVILHLESAAYHQVNEVGALTWSLIPDEGTDFAGLLTGLRTEFGDVEGLEDDIASFVNDLAARDLLLVGEPG